MQMQMEMSVPTKTVHSVSKITDLLKRLIEKHPPFQKVWVQGQVSNCSRSGPGHIYFTLKDENNQIRVAIFRNNAIRLRFLPKDGEEVIVQGKVGLYTARSEYQIVGTTLEPIGIGALQRAFEELKQQLAEEGLFDQVHKKPLPKFPKKIGVITSATGAAFQDICQQLDKRYPLVEVLLHPTLVQGEAAPEGIVHAIEVMNGRDDIDVLIVGRGGGSIEDLWAFNEEIVARAIFASRIPVVSAVGHETDVTISDWVSDRRAPTPSAAIEHIVPDQDELFSNLDSTETRFLRVMSERIQAHKTRLERFETGLSPTRRIDAINQLSQGVDDLETACRTTITHRLSNAERDLYTLAQRLNALSPLATLKRGYSISRKMDGQVLSSTEQVSVDDRIEVQLAHGYLVCRVEELRTSESD
jgi:exodeoxyribonuclease VII large subunit